MPDLIYNQAHVRLRKELVAALVDGTPCWRCGKGMFRGQRLQLGHQDSPDGRSIPGSYAGLEHAACGESAGGRVNPWGVRTRAEAAVAARSPERVQELDHKEARRTRKQIRAEFDAVQRAIAADEVVPVKDDDDRW